MGEKNILGPVPVADPVYEDIRQRHLIRGRLQKGIDRGRIDGKLRGCGKQRLTGSSQKSKIRMADAAKFLKRFGEDAGGYHEKPPVCAGSRPAGRGVCKWCQL